jgi:uncharacterized membrane protein
MSTFKATNTLDKVFEAGIVIKGLDGLVEFITGLVLLFISPTQMHSIIVFVTQGETAEDPKDKFVKLLFHSTQHYGAGSKTFIIAYLWIHAAIKLIAVIGILKNQIWAYPFSLIALGILMLYQVYTIIFVKVSVGMILLTVFDILILILIWREYGNVKTRLAENT